MSEHGIVIKSFKNLTDVATYKDFHISLGNFLDEFKRNPNRHELITQPPLSDVDNLDKTNLCILAAVSHKLANDYNLPVPNWVFEPQYKMPHPVFAFNTRNKEFQEYLFETTPYEFAVKNIYFGANCINRA